MTPEQIRELALCGVRGETIKAISDELAAAQKARRVHLEEFALCEEIIRRIMKELDPTATYITIALADSDHVEIAFCGDSGTEHEAEGWTLAEAYIAARSAVSCVDKALWG